MGSLAHAVRAAIYGHILCVQPVVGRVAVSPKLASCWGQQLLRHVVFFLVLQYLLYSMFVESERSRVFSESNV